MHGLPPPQLQGHEVAVDQGDQAEIEEEPEKDDTVELDDVQMNVNVDRQWSGCRGRNMMMTMPRLMYGGMMWGGFRTMMLEMMCES